jgi:hypothetical protein
MKTGDRLEHLRVLLHRLERMPPSADRDWMLSEVRARAVDVETGVTPAAVRALPLAEANAEIATVDTARVPAAATPVRRTPARPRRVAATPEPLAAPVSLVAVPAWAGHASAEDLLQPGVLLCLGDPAADTAAVTRPWVCGLRG